MQTLGNFNRRTGLLYGSLGLVALMVGMQAAFAAPPASTKSKAAKATESAGPSSVPSDAVARQIQKALAESQSQLGQLEPWQEKIFQDEVIPQSQRFIRDYRRSRTGIDVDVDIDTMKSYLRFNAPKALKKDAALIVVGLAPGEECEACAERLPAIRQLVKERLERRGFAVVFAKSSDPQLLTKLVDEKKADGTFTAAWARATADEIDAAHADEIRYAIKCQLALKDFSKQEGQLEIFETGSFEKSVGQLMTDFMTEIGGQVSHVVQRAGDSEQGAGISVEIRGIKGYAQYVRIKEKLQLLSESAGIAIDERKVSAGKAIFFARTIQGEKGVEAVRKAIGALVIDVSSNSPVAAATPSNVTPSQPERMVEKFRLQLVNSSDRSLEWEIR